MSSATAAKPDRLLRHVVVAFLLALAFYASFFYGLERWRVRRGPYRALASSRSNFQSGGSVQPAALMRASARARADYPYLDARDCPPGTRDPASLATLSGSPPPR